MLRSKAVQVRREGQSLQDRLLGQVDRIGRLGSFGYYRLMPRRPFAAGLIGELERVAQRRAKKLPYFIPVALITISQISVRPALMCWKKMGFRWYARNSSVAACRTLTGGI
jgi:hypothetical protein